MELEEKQYNYNDFTSQGTGNPDNAGHYKIISCSFDKYEIKIKLTLNNEFVEIVEVGINKDFLTQKQKISIQGFHDVEKFYIEQ